MPRSCRMLLMIFIFAVNICISSLGFANGFCPYPSIPEESASKGNYMEIPRGQCKLITIRGKLKYETVTLSLDETYGSGFFFNENNGPKNVVLDGTNQALVCSSSSSCGSTAILMDKPEGLVEISSLRSSAGKWVLISENECVISEDPNGPVSSYIYDRNYIYSVSVEKIQGKGRQREVISKRYRSNHYDCGTAEDSTCDDGFLASLGCDMGLDLNAKRERCLGAPVMPGSGGYPCEDPENPNKYAWCGCISYMSYHEWRCE